MGSCITPLTFSTKPRIFFTIIVIALHFCMFAGQAAMQGGPARGTTIRLSLARG